MQEVTVIAMCNNSIVEKSINLTLNSNGNEMDTDGSNPSLVIIGSSDTNHIIVRHPYWVSFLLG